MVIYIIISLFAIYGIYHFIQTIITKVKTGSNSCGGKLCLVPKPGDEGLEGKIRCAFMDGISEKLGTDGCLYVGISEKDPNRTVVERLSAEYPRLVLLDDINWSKIEAGDKQRH